MPVATTVASMAVAASMTAAIVTQNQVPLRAAPRDSAQQQAVLWPGEMVEVRGTRMNYVQVYDHKRERAGYIRADQLRRTGFAESEAPDMLAVIRFVRETPGAEALGIGYAAAYLKAAPASSVNGADGVEVLDALGTMADRLALRASSGVPMGKSAETALLAHLEVARQYGVKFTSHEADGRVQMCYDGEVFRRVIAMAVSPEQQARAALSLTRPECISPDLKPLDRVGMDIWRAEVLEHVETDKLPEYLKNRIRIRRAGVWSALAYHQARAGEMMKTAGIRVPGDAGAMAQRAITELSGVSQAELPDEDAAAYNDAAMRTNASRWATVPMPPRAGKSTVPEIVALPGQPGETCVVLIDAMHDLKQPLAKRCTYGVVWTASVSRNRESNALTLAVQPTESWREMWIFRKSQGNWDIQVLPPATVNPETGYAEFAGWVPGGKQMLVAREARGEGKYKRSFEVMNIDTLTTERRSNDPGVLGAFQRWQDASWKRMSLSVR